MFRLSGVCTCLGTAFMYKHCKFFGSRSFKYINYKAHKILNPSKFITDDCDICYEKRLLKQFDNCTHRCCIGCIKQIHKCHLCRTPFI